MFVCVLGGRESEEGGRRRGGEGGAGVSEQERERARARESAHASERE